MFQCDRYRGTAFCARQTRVVSRRCLEWNQWQIRESTGVQFVPSPLLFDSHILNGSNAFADPGTAFEALTTPGRTPCTTQDGTRGRRF